MVARSHVRRLPALGLLATIMRSPCPVHPLFTRTADQEPSWVPCGVRAAQGKLVSVLLFPRVMSRRTSVSREVRSASSAPAATGSHQNGWSNAPALS